MDDSAPGQAPEPALNSTAPASADSVEAIRELLSEAAKVSRELGQLAEDMVAQSEVGRREAQRLIGALSEATAALGSEAGEATPEAPPATPTPGAAGSDGARMLARQMLAKGTDRGVVERNLRTSFHVEDAAAVVDSILGGD